MLRQNGARTVRRVINRPQNSTHPARQTTLTRQARRYPPAHVDRSVFTPSKLICTREAYGGRSPSALQLDQPGTVSPYFPRNTIFVFHPPRDTSQKAEESVAAKYPAKTQPMTSHIDILTTPTADTPGACLYVHFDRKRYVFGRLAEGAQRAFNYRKISSQSIGQIFVSGEVSWGTVGGMMGFLLTLADTVKSSREALAETNKERGAKGQKLISREIMERLDIHGAENLTYCLATTRHFLFRTKMPFKTFELSEDRRLADPKVTGPDWEDENLRVWKIPLSKQCPSRKRRREDEGGDKGEDMEVDSTTHKRRKSGEQRVLSDLVESMFNSDWNMDALVPTKLLDVQLPAAIFVRDEDNSLHRYRGPLPEPGKDVPNIDVWVREPWPATKVHTLPQTQYSSQSMCYIAKNHARRGKFKANVAKELGVKPADNKKLVDGQNVPGKDGITVTPEMVLEPPIKGTGFVVADIPDAAYISSFLSRPEWANEELMDGIAMIYWLLGQGVVSHPDIQAFMKERPQLKHIVLSPDTCPNMLAFDAHACLTAKLRRVDPERFPTFSFSNLVPDLGLPDVPLIGGRTGKKIRTMPQLQIQDQDIVPFCNPDQEALHMDGEVLRLAAAASEKAADPKFLEWVEESEKDIPNRDTEITPLGTGSAMPSKYRNVSSTLIRVPGYGAYLLDCGENTLGQMRRAYGYEETDKILSELRLIFISHMHADHHLGTASVIDAWQRATAGTSSTLAICSPYAMRHFIEELSQMQPIELSRLRFYGDTHSDTNYEHAFEEGDPTGLSEITRLRVEHCRAAHAGVLTWPSGLKIAYSGDCRPSGAFAKKAQGATLLVHEATFEDDKRAEAEAKKHSTMADALWVAEKMGARRVLLTHFSQRYAKIATNDGAQGDDRVVLNAFDQMRVKLGDFRKAELFLPAIRKLLEETVAEEN
ncbi:hypothetical protein VUR80DRAFT_487 [Thermomyces stellatus]